MDTVIQACIHGRDADALELAAALTQGRARLLAMFAGFEAALGDRGLRIAFDPVLNLPLWELGHIGWFEAWWIARNRDRARGIRFDAALPRAGSLLRGADAWYDSANVPHATRWQLELPDANATRDYLEQVRAATLALLRHSGPGDDALYFFRLVLLHEDMHREAWFMMAQQLSLDLGVTLPNPFAPHKAGGEWQVAGGQRSIGASGRGFAFDNELSAHGPFVEAFSIDRAAVDWRRYLPFIEAGGYDDQRVWTPDGWHWRRQQPGQGWPPHLRRTNDGAWQQRRFGHWSALDLDTPAVHLSLHEAAAWCHFAGRRLPTEVEWESAARLAAEHDEAFDWGRVWEWTASAFTPYAGFAPHPYREYSAPFFDGRPVLRGGSAATEPRLLHAAYRNYFGAERRDVFAGFRSCALG